MKKIIVIINVVAIFILIVSINYPGNITEYVFAWLLFLVPLIIFDTIVFCIPKIYKKLFSEKTSLSRKIIYVSLLLFSLGFIFAATLVTTSFASKLLSGPEGHGSFSNK